MWPLLKWKPLCKVKFFLEKTNKQTKKQKKQHNSLNSRSMLGSSQPPEPIYHFEYVIFIFLKMMSSIWPSSFHANESLIPCQLYFWDINSLFSLFLSIFYGPDLCGGSSPYFFIWTPRTMQHLVHSSQGLLFLWVEGSGHPIPKYLSPLLLSYFLSDLTPLIRNSYLISHY